MNLLAIIPLCAFLANLFLLVLSFRSRSKAAPFFSAYLLSLALWSFSSFALHIELPVLSSRVWLELCLVFGAGMWYFVYHFILFFLNLEGTRLRFTLWAAHALLLAILIADATGYLVESTRVGAGGEVYVQSGSLMPLMYTSTVFLMFPIVLMARAYRQTKDPELRNRIAYPMVGLVLITAGVLTNISSELSKYPFDLSTNLINAVLVSYAILRHRLLDISLVIRRGLAYSFLTVVLATVYMAAIFVSERLLRGLVGYSAYVAPFIVAAVVALAFRPLQDAAQSWIDRIFYRQRYNLNQVLQEVSVTAASILALGQLLDLLLGVITDEMGVAKAGVFLFDEEADAFYLAAWKESETVEDMRLWLAREHPLVHGLSQAEKILARREVEGLPGFKELREEERERLKALDAELLIPLWVRESLIGILVVGPKRSQLMYSLEEERILLALASQTAVAVENARLFETTQHQVEELRRASEEQQRLLDTVRELSTPIIPMLDRVLVMPLVGDIDTRRAQDIMEAVLSGINIYGADVVIIDITGVPVVDTSVANHLMRTAQAAGLLGSRCVLVGIRPEVAQAIVNLGVDLSRVVTRGDLQGGIDYALGVLGRRIVRN